jgi:hypothetical protein
VNTLNSPSFSFAKWVYRHDSGAFFAKPLYRVLLIARSQPRVRDTTIRGTSRAAVFNLNQKLLAQRGVT